MALEIRNILKTTIFVTTFYMANHKAVKMSNNLSLP